VQEFFNALSGRVRDNQSSGIELLLTAMTSGGRFYLYNTIAKASKN
jgi:hypothetical protein